MSKPYCSATNLMQLLAIALSPPVVLALATPSQAAGMLPISGEVPINKKVVINATYSLNAHPKIHDKGTMILEFNANETDNPKSPILLPFKTLGGDKEVHGTISKHSVRLDFKPPSDRKVKWTLTPTATIEPSCKPNVEKCTNVTATTTVKISYGDIVQGETTATVTLDKDGKVIPQDPPAKDPVITLYLDDQAFFSADIFATSASASGLEPTLHADFSFGTLAPGYDLTLFYGGLSCGLATCASDTSFLNSLQSVVSTGPGGNWSFDPVLQEFTPKNDIVLPDFLYTNSINQGATGTFGADTGASDPGVEVPGPLPILGIGAAFGYCRKLRNRTKNSRTEAISTTAA